MKIFSIFLILIIIITLNTVTAQAGKPTLSVEGTARPGSVLFLTIKGLSLDAKVTGKWEKFNLNFFKNGENWRTIIPISRHISIGNHNLTINITDQNNNNSFSRAIKISRHHFGSQYLSLPKSQSDKYDDPALDKEYDLMYKTLSTVSYDFSPNVPFKLPVDAPVTTPYGLTRFINNEQAGWHKALDLGAGSGEPIIAPQKGKVILARNGLIIHGNTIVIDHGYGLLSLYLHLNKINVKEGAIVSLGTKIGTVGSSGVASGPHLHWGTYIYGVPVDPQVLISIPKTWQDQAISSTKQTAPPVP